MLTLLIILALTYFGLIFWWKSKVPTDGLSYLKLRVPVIKEQEEHLVETTDNPEATNTDFDGI